MCTAAVADILLNGRDPAATMQAWCPHYPACSWGGRFGRWIHEEAPVPYGSYGSGAAMRVSPAAFLNRSRPLADGLAAADRVTRITHGHPEGMKGAQATNHAIWLTFQGGTRANRSRPRSEDVRGSTTGSPGKPLPQSADQLAECGVLTVVEDFRADLTSESPELGRGSPRPIPNVRSPHRFPDGSLRIWRFEGISWPKAL